MPSRNDCFDPENTVIGLHYTDFGTDDKAEMLSNLQYPAERPYPRDIYAPCRYNALYAWPFDHPRVLNNAELYDSDLDEHTVYFEVPEDQVKISSYSFLNSSSLDPEPPHSIHFRHYESALTFSPEQLQDACEKYNLPHSPSNLIL